MKKLLALVLAMACALSLGIPTLAKTADYTWNQVNVEDFVDEDGDKIADDDVIRPGQTIYWVFGKYSDYDYLLDDKMVKIDVDKDEGSKNIDGKPKVVGKKLGNLGRCVALEIVIKDTYTADELKTKLDIYITAKKDLVASNAGIPNEFPQYDEGTITTGSANVQDLQRILQEKKDNLKKLTDELAKLNASATTKDSIAWIQAQYDALKAWEDGKITVGEGVGEKSYKDLASAAEAAKNAYTSADARDQAIGPNDKAGTGELPTALNNLDNAKNTKTAAETTINKCTSVTIDLPSPGTSYTITPNAATEIETWTAAGGNLVGTVAISSIADEPTKTAILDEINRIIGSAKTDYDDAVQTIKNLAGTEGDASVSGTIKTLLDEKAGLDVAGKKKISDAYDAALNDNAYKTALANYTPASANYVSADAANTALEQANNRKTALGSESSGEIKTATDAVKQAETDLKNGAQTVGGIGYLKKSETMKVPMTIWIQNENRVDDDATFVAGEKGVVIKPVKNEENTVTWEDNNDTLAIMKFTADSDVEYYMPRMATKWNNEDYLDYFDDMDAYIRSFVGNPSIPCTSRARLWINNPFVDDDGEETIDPDDIYVYEVVDGELYDITDKVEYTTNDDDDYAFLIKTRTLGTYIFSDGPADIEDEDDDDYDPEAPDKVEVNNNKKPVPPTGF